MINFLGLFPLPTQVSCVVSLRENIEENYLCLNPSRAFWTSLILKVGMSLSLTLASRVHSHTVPATLLIFLKLETIRTQPEGL